MEIPRGSSRADIKARKQIIKDYYAKWNAEHPDKRVWNKALNADIHYLGEKNASQAERQESKGILGDTGENKSRLGSDFWGLASRFLERVVVPSARIPLDDSTCKGMNYSLTCKMQEEDS